MNKAKTSFEPHGEKADRKLLHEGHEIVPGMAKIFAHSKIIEPHRDNNLLFAVNRHLRDKEDFSVNATILQMIASIARSNGHFKPGPMLISHHLFYHCGLF